MMHCPKCSAEAQPGSRFCANCGNSLQTACPQCGFANAPGAKFCGGCGQAVGAAPTPGPAPAEPAAERRQLTVMFCDLVDSTVLSTQLDPEDHREVLRTYQSVCAQAIGRYDGYIAQFLGDGIMAYFGYPKAHEDDAERSVLAGLAIVEAVSKIEIQGLQIRTRVGIATGLVVVGDKIAKGTDWEIGVVGETPNLAARIQGVAQPGTVVIGPTTWRLLGGQFAYEALGPQRFKGFAEPVPVWRVLAEIATASRFKAVRGFEAALVDRREEQALLRDLGARAAGGGCQTVLIQGEAGIGKSRLARALAEWMAGYGGARLVEMQCSAHHTHSALFPAINALWQLVSGGGDRPREPGLAWEALAGFLGEVLPGDAAEALPLFANLLSIPLPEGVPALALPPEQQRGLTLRHLLDLLAGCGGGGPVLLLMEDLHWADPSTLEFVAHIVEHGGDRPLLALFTSRPDFAPPWAGGPRVTLVPLGRLPNDDAAELVRQTLGGQGLAEDIVESVVAKTDGVPLYLQEYTKAVAESRQDAGAGGGRRASVIPSTLHDLLLARLDRLGEAKAAAQLAALLGREFDGGLLEAVWPSSPQSLGDALDVLVREEVVYPKGDESHPRYVFRHALLQDAAYESMLKSSRAALHRRIGEAVERGFPDIVATEPEWLAQHFASANLPSRAIPYWEQAGQRAGRLAAFAEAGRHFEAALGQLAKLPEEPARHGQELGLQLQLGTALTASLGYAADAVEVAYQRARALCGLLGDTAELFPVLIGLTNFYIVRGHLGRALELAWQIVRLTRQTGQLAQQVVAHCALGYTLAYAGRLREAEETLAGNLKTCQECGGEGLEYPGVPNGTDVTILALLSIVEWMAGQCRRSFRHSGALEDLLAGRGRRLEAYDQAYAHGFLGFLELLRGRFDHVARHTALVTEISRAADYKLWLLVGQAHEVLVNARLGGISPAAIKALRTSLDARIAGGSVTIVQYYIMQLAEFYRAVDEPWLALAAIEEAFAYDREDGELWFLAEHHRVRGELLLSQGEAEKGEADLRQALKTAQSQGAKLFQLRAALSLWRMAAGGAEAAGVLGEALRQIDPEDGALLPEWQEAARLLAPPGL